MAHLIDKDALVAEIEKRKKEWSYGSSTEAKYKVEAYKEVIELLNTIDVKEVDLDFTKEVDMWVRDNGDTNGFFNVEELAKHFFELGLKAQKGE